MAKAKSFCAMRQRTRASSQSGDRKKKKPQGPTRHCRAMHGGIVQPTENRAALFRAAFQQPQRDRDRCICQCQTQLWRCPVSRNIQWSPTVQIRYQHIDSGLSIYIHSRKCVYVLPALSCKGICLLSGETSGVKCTKSITKLLRKELFSWHIWKCFSANWGREKGVEDTRLREEKGCKNIELW